jgi:hypothetical protein
MQRLITTFSTGARWRLLRIFIHSQSSGRSLFEDDPWDDVKFAGCTAFSIVTEKKSAAE